ncbi:hypothetical protein NUW54_g9105 [Trametes sanguinea]|uniref:Uncharacterized protein n=1 Tax=Trametes sanguinea TaxID=158606 RepID=A0ACC1PA69_9APHY|nr:hypothetical protein NUW54_g9105 [Trametes sanguinea]
MAQALSAADLQVRPSSPPRSSPVIHTCDVLQRRHELEGAPDPFPSLVDDSPAKPRASRSNGVLDTDSQEAFPSLAPAAQPGNKPAAPAWGANAGPRIKPQAAKQPLVSDSFILSSIDLSTAGKDGKPVSLGEVMRQVMAQYKVKLDASTNQKSHQTTFYLKSESKKELEKAKKSLLALLSPTEGMASHSSLRRCLSRECPPVLHQTAVLFQAILSDLAEIFLIDEVPRALTMMELRTRRIVVDVTTSGFIVQ